MEELEEPLEVPKGPIGVYMIELLVPMKALMQPIGISIDKPVEYMEATTQEEEEAS